MRLLAHLPLIATFVAVAPFDVAAPLTDCWRIRDLMLAPKWRILPGWGSYLRRMH